MSNLFSKHLHLCFFKLKYPACTSTATTLSPPHPQQHHRRRTPSPSSSSSSSSSSSASFTLNHHSSTSTSDPDPAPDLAAVFASQRFFFSSPGHSNSIIPSPNSVDVAGSGTCIPRGGVGVPKYSLNPYVDFRRSMQEMIESREVVVDVRQDWDYLHELLLCYLALNPTHTHKCIIRAFTDLVVDLLSSSGMANQNI